MSSQSETNVTTIAKLQPTDSYCNIRFVVMDKGDSRIVRIRSSDRKALVCDVTVADETASIRLTLWNDDVDFIETGRAYALTGGRVGLYDESMFLTRGRGGAFRQIDEDLVPSLDPDMSGPFAWKQVKSRKRSERGTPLTGHRTREVRGYSRRKGF
ncbi:MAG: hypothetical protein ACP6KW_04885 [Candidatus Thorarchaeota archaeon]